MVTLLTAKILGRVTLSASYGPVGITLNINPIIIDIIVMHKLANYYYNKTVQPKFFSGQKIHLIHLLLHYRSINLKFFPLQHCTIALVYGEFYSFHTVANDTTLRHLSHRTRMEC